MAVRIGVLETYQPERPKEGVINRQPSLLAKPGNILALGNALRLGERREHVLHGGGAQACEEQDAKQYQVAIVPAQAVVARAGVAVRQRKVLGCVVARARHAVGEEEESDQVEGEAWGFINVNMVCLARRIKGTAIGVGRTNLVVDKPPSKLLHGALVPPLGTANQDDIALCLPVEGPVHVLRLARLAHRARGALVLCGGVAAMVWGRGWRGVHGRLIHQLAGRQLTVVVGDIACSGGVSAVGPWSGENDGTGRRKEGRDRDAQRVRGVRPTPTILNLGPKLARISAIGAQNSKS